MANDGSITKTEYSNIHHFLQYQYGLPQKCEDCGLVGSRKNKWSIEWALKHGRQYSRNIGDYRQLCSSCHRYYDYTENQKKLLRVKSKGNKNAAKKVMQLKDGLIIKVFSSITEASKETGILRTAINNAVVGKSIKAGKYEWRHVGEEVKNKYE